MTTGTLPNGLRYYIRRNSRPEKRVMLQLAVKAGSVDETDEQQGLAHFLEHMAFNGSRSFKAGRADRGARVDRRAHGAARQRLHVVRRNRLHVPGADRQGRDRREGRCRRSRTSRGGMTLDPKEIDKERGVVIEEWRGGLGAGVAAARPADPGALSTSRSTPSGCRSASRRCSRAFTPERLRAFYTTWYRPDRMAVVVVGDIDPAQIEAQVKAMFGALPKAGGAAAGAHLRRAAARRDCWSRSPPIRRRTQSSVSIMRKRQRGTDGTVADYRREPRPSSSSYQMLNERFDELSRKPDAQFLGAGAYDERARARRSSIVRARRRRRRKARSCRASSALEIEANRVQQHGFGAGGARSREEVDAGLLRARVQRARQERERLVRPGVRQPLPAGRAGPGIEYEYRLAQALLPAITAAEVADAARGAVRRRQPRDPRDLAAEGRAGGADRGRSCAPPIAQAEAVAVTAWNDAGSGKRADGRRCPIRRRSTDRREIAELGVTVVRFANGVEAWLKPTDFKNDQVLFSPGRAGRRVARAAREVTSRRSLAPALVQLSGAGGPQAPSICRSCSPASSPARAPFDRRCRRTASPGRPRPANLETGLQLLYLDFTAPGNDDEAFAHHPQAARRDVREPRPATRALLFGEKVGAGQHRRPLHRRSR